MAAAEIEDNGRANKNGQVDEEEEEEEVFAAAKFLTNTFVKVREDRCILVSNTLIPHRLLCVRDLTLSSQARKQRRYKAVCF